jgi:hypothetical protein
MSNSPFLQSIRKHMQVQLLWFDDYYQARNGHPPPLFLQVAPL